jgi:hypothetical protein
MEQYHYSLHEMQAWLHGGLDAAVSKRKCGTGHLHVDIAI